MAVSVFFSWTAHADHFENWSSSIKFSIFVVAPACCLNCSPKLWLIFQLQYPFPTLWPPVLFQKDTRNWWQNILVVGVTARRSLQYWNAVTSFCIAVSVRAPFSGHLKLVERPCPAVNSACIHTCWRAHTLLNTVAVFSVVFGTKAFFALDSLC